MIVTKTASAMAKHPQDFLTLPLIPEPKKRGRPISGKALTAAQRKANERKRKGLNGIVSFEFSQAELARLIVALNECAPEFHDKELLDKLKTKLKQSSKEGVTVIR
ncbi:hypothetical protein HQ393_04520 [Chitinibacter bivalviorum]|uniref:Uncharacterized protein n=1 Tax=Chitinibacter bivalviorum TaxID=2739434 RepID=A0A7H9BG64_9NEIS|nr:hypothetical protein [Chitinibacter bivalviorum]QLG87575.1 hypothetical protein HQ393_04520 [Chitinibacter bivalviorum]